MLVSAHRELGSAFWIRDYCRAEARSRSWTDLPLVLKFSHGEMERLFGGEEHNHTCGCVHFWINAVRIANVSEKNKKSRRSCIL